MNAIINTMHKHDDKSSGILNKADGTTHRQLIRVHGALTRSVIVFKRPRVANIRILIIGDLKKHMPSTGEKSVSDCATCASISTKSTEQLGG